MEIIIIFLALLFFFLIAQGIDVFIYWQKDRKYQKEFAQSLKDQAIKYDLLRSRMIDILALNIINHIKKNVKN